MTAVVGVILFAFLIGRYFYRLHVYGTTSSVEIIRIKRRERRRAKRAAHRS